MNVEHPVSWSLGIVAVSVAVTPNTSNSSILSILSTNSSGSSSARPGEQRAQLPPGRASRSTLELAGTVPAIRQWRRPAVGGRATATSRPAIRRAGRWFRAHSAALCPKGEIAVSAYCSSTVRFQTGLAPEHHTVLKTIGVCTRMCNPRHRQTLRYPVVIQWEWLRSMSATARRATCRRT